MKYPKLPTGPSSDGASGVRALQAVGGDWQYKQVDGQTKAFQQGAFQKVILEGDPLYVAAGLTTPSRVSIRDVFRVPSAAMPSIWSAFGVSMDRGQFARWVRGPVDDTAPQDITYIPVTGIYRNVQYRQTPLTLVLNGLRKNAVAAAEVVADQVFTATYTPPYLVEPPIAYLGDNKVFSVVPVFAGREDSAGRQLHSPMLLVASRKEAQTRLLGLPDGFLTHPPEMAAQFVPFVTEGAAFVLGLQPLLTVPAFYDPALVLSSPTTKAWLYVFAGHDLSINAMTEIDGGGLASNLLTPTTANPSGVFVGEADDTAINDCLATAGRTMDSVRVLALPGDVALIFAETAHALSWLNGETLTTFSASHARRINVTRIAYSDGVVSSSHVWQSPYYIPSNPSAPVLSGLQAANPQGVIAGEGLPRIQGAAYLGNGVVLAKKSSGHAGIYGSLHPTFPDPANVATGHDVSFMRSLDFGVTWTEFVPFGFDSSMQNQYFGDLITHQAQTENSQGSVLTTSWDGTSYHVYESKDLGDTWQKRARLAKPDTFRRMDSWRPGDGGRHFGELRQVGTRIRPVDVSVPNRYKRT